MMDFLEEENKELRRVIRQIVQDMQDMMVPDAIEVFDIAFNNGITSCLGVIEQEAGVTIEEILEPKFRG